jgi:hypothetical protein
MINPYVHCKDLQRDFPITEDNRLNFLQTYKPFVCLNITSRCTHNCWYCISGRPVTAPLKSVVDEIGPDMYVKRILDLAGGKVCTYRISGGEPMEHPAFYQILLGILSAGHDVDIVSNLLYFERIVTDKLKPYRKQINFEISYHLGEYMLDDSPDREKAWFRSYQLACQYGHSIRPITPMTPKLLESDCESKFDVLEEIAQESGCEYNPNIMELYATVDDKTYPRDYTTEQRDRLFELRCKYYKTKPTRESVDTISEVNRRLYLCGLTCFYMNRLVYVFADGHIEICGSGIPSQYVGDVKRDIIFKMSDTPEPCSFDACTCVSKGISACLEPHRITPEKYLEYYRRYNQ